MAAQLFELRNKFSIAFIIANVIFVSVVFAFQMSNFTVNTPWPCDGIKVQPVGLVFMIVFGVIMVVQIIGMLCHRASTFLHIMSTTVMACFAPKKGANAATDDVDDMIVLAKEMGRLRDEDQVSLSSQMTGVSVESDGDDGSKTKNMKSMMVKINKTARTMNKQSNMTVTDAFHEEVQQVGEHGSIKTQT